MANKVFQLNDQTAFMIRELGGHMPGGFFIYKAEEPEELLYANNRRCLHRFPIWHSYSI